MWQGGGQTIPTAHIFLILRRKGDMDDLKVGVCGVAHEK